MQLLFVNTTDGSRLSREQSKRMRGHVAKTVNSERRRRRALTYKVADAPSGDQITIPSPLSSSPSGPLLPYQLLWSTTLSYWHDPQENTPHQVAFTDLIVSEPALLESTLAVNARNWSPDSSFQRRAEAHVSRAISIVIDRIQRGCAHTDGLLGAVATLALGESLLRNEPSWHLHMDGIAQILQDRRSKGLWELPEWFTGMLVMDIMNNVMRFPRVFPANIGEILQHHGNSELSRAVMIGNRLAHLRQMLESYRAQVNHHNTNFEEVEAAVQSLCVEAQSLGSSPSPYVRATSIAMELYLHFAWPDLPRSDASGLAQSLRDALRQLPVKPCPYMDLTSTSFILGLVAAGHGSETRSWFLSRLRAVVTDMESRGWQRPVEHLEKAIESDRQLADRFKAIWDDSES